MRLSFAGMRYKKAAVKNPAPSSSTSQSKKRPRAQPQQGARSATPRKISEERWSKDRRRKLATMAFGNSQYLDWKILRDYGIEAQIRELLDVGPWAKLLEIHELAYREVTLEVLSTLQLEDQLLTFQVYGKPHRIPTYQIGMVFNLYLPVEANSLEFSRLPTDWPRDMTPQLFWEELIGAPPRAPGVPPEAPFKYLPSRSKATLLTNVNWRVVHHLLAHTIGQRKSSHGVVNTFEIFYLYTMARRQRIDIGYQVAKYFERQATDPRVKGIYCGGYITKLLKGFNIFQEPDPATQGIPSRKISDGPFQQWGLVKLFHQPTPPRPVTSPSVPSTSRSQSQETELQHLTRVVEEERRLNQQERRKNKRFRSAVWAFLNRLAGCFSPPPTNLPVYESSPEPNASTPDTHKKVPVVAESSSSEEEDDEEDEEDDEEDDEEGDEEDKDDDGSGETDDDEED